MRNDENEPNLLLREKKEGSNVSIIRLKEVVLDKWSSFWNSDSWKTVWKELELCPTIKVELVSVRVSWYGRSPLPSWQLSHFWSVFTIIVTHFWHPRITFSPSLPYIWVSKLSNILSILSLYNIESKGFLVLKHQLQMMKSGVLGHFENDHDLFFLLKGTSYVLSALYTFTPTMVGYL